MFEVDLMEEVKGIKTMSEIEILDDGQDLTAKQAAEFEKTIEQAAEQATQAATGTATEQPQIIPAVLSPADFEKHFFEIFDVIGDLWDMPEFKIQKDKPFEIAGAKVSAAKLYLMANKYKMLHFLIEPAGGWFGDAIAIACFAGAKANVLCKRYTGNPLTGYLRRFMKKSGEQVKNNSLMSKIFKKGGENDDKKD